ncbi:MAG TPA: ChaN family lipoprotein [Candidatus Xenobia bacterium]|jgi:uncharacterized iron-regulated protein
MFKKLVLPLLCLLATRPGLADPRIFASADQTFISQDTLLARLSGLDVVMVGEAHDNAPCHAFELALLEGLTERRPALTLGLEMFERDVQPVLDGYTAGTTTEAEFAAASRPWPNYATDYRPLVEWARQHHEVVLATDVPRSLAATVAHAGLQALRQVPPHVMRYFARHVDAPDDRYYSLFQDAMGQHGGGDAALFYQAQCLKDDTMAESMADFLDQMAPDRPFMLHINGAFHTDFGLGTAARLRTREPALKTAVVSLIPVDDPNTTDAALYAARGDYVVLVGR